MPWLALNWVKHSFYSVFRNQLYCFRAYRTSCIVSGPTDNAFNRLWLNLPIISLPLTLLPWQFLLDDTMSMCFMLLLRAVVALNGIVPQLFLISVVHSFLFQFILQAIIIACRFHISFSMCSFTILRGSECSILFIFLYPDRAIPKNNALEIVNSMTVVFCLQEKHKNYST